MNSHDLERLMRREELQKTNDAAAKQEAAASWRWKIRYRELLSGMMVAQLYCAWSTRIDMGLGWELITSFVVPTDVLRSFIRTPNDVNATIDEDGWTEEML